MQAHQRWLYFCGIFALLAFMQTPVELWAQGVPAANSDGAQVAQNSDSATNEAGNDESANSQDPPGRVAQLSHIEGAVSFQPGGEKDWLDAVLNRPLVSGDNLWADQNSRAELHIGSTALHLDSMTGITLLEVSDHAVQVRLVQGTLIVRVRHVDDEDSYEIDTPNVAFVVAQPGAYRIDVDGDGTRSDVTVWHGGGEVTGGGSAYTIAAGQHATFTGADQLSYDLTQLPGSDGFDAWATQRDDAEDESDSANYVSREATGYEDLDQYGSWMYVAGYGTVWQPTALAAGWAPYRYGHWMWVNPWGWTWVADEPWGFAPFHYGRWALAGANWVWVPGPAAVRPTYAPALVGWVGGGPGARFSFGAGVGWFPLAPGEVFLPYYRVSRTYVNTVNLTNTHVEMTKITNAYNSVAVNRSAAMNDMTYANRNVAGGVTVVSRETFVNSRPVGQSVVSVPAKELAAMPVSSTVSAKPVRASVIGAGSLAGNKPPAAMSNRQVVGLRTPAPMPNSFAQQQNGRHLNQAQLVRQQQPGTPKTWPAQAVRTTESDDGFRPFTPSTPAANNPARNAPVVWEEQGTPEPPKTPKNEQNADAFTGTRNQQPAKPSAQRSSSSAKLAPAVQAGKESQHEDKFSASRQQKPATTTQKAQTTSATAKPASTPPAAPHK
jgi:hypothetical protein